MLIQFGLIFSFLNLKCLLTNPPQILWVFNDFLWGWYTTTDPEDTKLYQVPLSRKGNMGGGEGTDKGLLFLLPTCTCCSLVYTPWKAFDELILLSSISLSSFISLSTKPWVISKLAIHHTWGTSWIMVCLCISQQLCLVDWIWACGEALKNFYLQSESLGFLFWSIFIQPQSSINYLKY